MIPDWSDAPEWAQFLAQDKFGNWFWYETPPKRDKRNHVWYVDEGRTVGCSRKHNASWEKTLKVRPLEKKFTRGRR